MQATNDKEDSVEAEISSFITKIFEWLVEDLSRQTSPFRRINYQETCLAPWTFLDVPRKNQRIVVPPFTDLGTPTTCSNSTPPVPRLAVAGSQSRGSSGTQPASFPAFSLM